MKSLRRQLTVALGISIGTLLATGGLAIFVVTKEVLEDQFDDTLTAKATALIAAAEIDDDEFEIDLSIQDFAGFGPGGDDYFEIRRGDGSVLAASPSLHFPGKSLIPPLPVPSGPAATLVSGKLADQRPARFFLQRFVPDDADTDEYRDLSLAAASPTRELQTSLWVLGSVIASVGGLMALLTLPLLRLVLTRGLRPLADLSRQVQAIPVSQLDARLDLASQPAELVPLGTSLNAWLARMENSFERERRFSSHAAHELRTPLAELKMIAELGVKWPDDATPARCAEMIAIVDEMEALLAKLSWLARADAGQQPAELAAVDLSASVAAAVDRAAPAAAARGIAIHPHIADGAFRTDPVLWATILQNLLANAVAHAPPGSAVTIAASPAQLTVSNPAPDLQPADLDQLCERFWRKNPSHSGHAHAGLGLSIVEAAAALLGSQCTFSLSADQRFQATIVWPPTIPER